MSRVAEPNHDDGQGDGQHSGHDDGQGDGQHSGHDDGQHSGQQLPAAGELTRRTVLRGAGLIGAGVTVGTGLAAPAQALATGSGRCGGRDRDPHGGRDRDPHGGRRRDGQGYFWLAGDHHVHTQFSSDGLYRVIDQARHARAHGLDWLVITDHGRDVHAQLGVGPQNAAIRAARPAVPELLLFHGLEWNVPAAEHGTVFVHPGPEELAVLREFENTHDAALSRATAGTADNEALAIAGLDFLAEAVSRHRVADALFLANHPSMNGLDSPHEIRGWRTAQPRIAVGMEGAPGHQAAGIPSPEGPGLARGLYDRWPSTEAFPGYPAESYQTWGGFDWMTATVGGLWDSLLAEGLPWWITLGSDVHKVYADTTGRGPGAGFLSTGYHPDPAYSGRVRIDYTAFWPGCYSRTHVGATEFSYAAVMAGIRAGRVWVDHGGLISGLRVVARVAGESSGVPLGGTLVVRPGQRVELVITVTLAETPNWAQFVPTLSRVDVIAGAVTGPVSERDTFVAPDTRVMQSFEITQSTGRVTLTHPIGPVERPMYLRVRGTDGNRGQPGWRGAAVDPAGPAMDLIGAADPWGDLWFYANPIFVVPRGSASAREGGLSVL